MRRLLAPALAAALAAASTARAEPYDMDFRKLGDPATDAAKARFGILSSEMALALTGAVLQPGSTTGHSGFDFALEGYYVGIHPDAAGPGTWPVRAEEAPHELFLPSFHVRKAFPFSLEMGGRIIWVSQSSYAAAQVEGKWALNEGSRHVPDLAVRVAFTSLFGHRTWNLSTTDLDVTVSKAFPVNGVLTLTPYLAARFTFMKASTDVMVYETITPPAAYPNLRSTFYRTTLGVRLKTYAVSIAAEATRFGGAEEGGDDYPEYDVPSSWGGAARFGFEF